MFIHHCSFCLKSIGAFLTTAMDTFAATKEMRNLVVPHSFETGDNLVLMPCSDLHPDTKAATKEMRNLVDLRPTKKEMLERMLWKLVLYRPQCHL